MLASIVIAGLFAWEYFIGASELNEQLPVPLYAAIAAGATFVFILVSYFVAPTQRLKGSATLNYALFLASTTYLVVSTGALDSAYLSLWVAALAFAGWFGLGGVVVGTAALAAFIVHEYLITGLAGGDIVQSVLIGALPLIASFLVWGRSLAAANQQTKEDKSYHELAGELSKVSGKSEVVINAIGEGVLAIDGQGVIELMNPAAEQLLGWPRHDALTLSYKSILKMKDTKNQAVTDANDPVAQVIASNKPVKNDSFSLETQSGKTFLASITVNPVGQLGQGVIVVFRDITSEKSDERQRAEFISTASHEMRTPVASIEGYLGLALNPATATIDEKARDFITKAHESAQHLGRLFSDLLDVSKADDSRLKNDPKIVDVVPFVHDIVQGLTPKATEKGLRVLYKPMPDGGSAGAATDPVRRLNPVFYANVDNDHLREVAQNLVENAIKYTPKGEVVVDVTGDETHVIISITDTGIGIPREDQAHLFQKFYRVDNSDTREIGGTGLGLYLCRRLAETMGGRIWVESEYKRGSTFFVEVPRTDHDEAQRLIEQASVEAEREAELTREQSIRESEAQQAAALEAIAAPGAEITPVQPVAPEAPQIVPLVDTVLPQPTIAIPADTPPTPPMPQPIAPPVALPQEPIAPAPQFAAPNPAANTPLSAIEANPGQYVTRQVAGINIPPRR